jgi:hypothetical protein
MRRSRGSLALWTTLVVALGLACRAPFAPPFALLYLGDVLWGAMFFLLAAGLFPSASSWVLGLAALAITEAIELSQLCRAPRLDGLRDTRLGGLLLGHGFSWSDVLCVALGAALAALADRTVASRSAMRISSRQ